MAKIKVNSVKQINKGSLKAFASVTIADKLTVNSIRVVQQTGQAAWVSLPQNEVKAADGGKSKYFPIIEIHDEELKREIIKAVLAEFTSLQPAGRQTGQAIPAGW
jgi:DNA-binding cell septation regulator SpoVG